MSLPKKIEKLRSLVEALDVGYGPEGADLSWQRPFDLEAKCHVCGKPARMALVIKEREGPQYVSDIHPNDPKGEGFWLHDAGAYAIYLCRDIECAAATTIWNQA